MTYRVSKDLNALKSGIGPEILLFPSQLIYSSNYYHFIGMTTLYVFKNLLTGASVLLILIHLLPSFQTIQSQWDSFNNVCKKLK